MEVSGLKVKVKTSPKVSGGLEYDDSENVLLTGRSVTNTILVGLTMNPVVGGIVDAADANGSAGSSELD